MLQCIPSWAEQGDIGMLQQLESVYASLRISAEMLTICM